MLRRLIRFAQCKTINKLLKSLRRDEVDNRRLQWCQRHLFVKHTAGVKDDEAPSTLDFAVPDLSLFDSNFPGAVMSFGGAANLTNKKEPMTKGLGGACKSSLGWASWAWMVSFIEANNDPQWEPFDLEQDTGDFSRGVSMRRGDTGVHIITPGLKAGALGERSRSQIIQYVSQIQLRQHRNFVLCAHIRHEWVSFMRWDRTGAILSKAVNYKQFPLVLLEFICRLATTDSDGQGYDTSARLIRSPRRTLNAFRAQKKGKWEAPYIENMLADLTGFPIYEVRLSSFNLTPVS